ncbi:hypothetical protein D5047_11600 [Verminephrobacter eiseniae]|nr:hypothetical protein [Verminephrobacter eiseniae]
MGSLWEFSAPCTTTSVHASLRDGWRCLPPRPCPSEQSAGSAAHSALHGLSADVAGHMRTRLGFMDKKNARMRAILRRAAHRVGAALALLSVVFAALVFSGAATAQTLVSDPIVVNTRWSTANAPYIVSGEVALQNGAVLSIDPGVVVYMAANSGFTVRSGTVRAAGTAQNPIRVLSENQRSDRAASPGDWNQWVFEPGTTNTRLDHVEFAHGRGLAVHGAAPVFNHLNLRNHLGAAISIDLAAAPSGVGLQASGNTLNGIAVPAGAITGTVQWGLRGIPYVVAAGVVSVGVAPAITSISPGVVEQGQTVALTVHGVRLADLQEVGFDRAGLAATVFPGGTDSQVTLQVRADAAAQPGPARLRLQVDAGEVVQTNAITVTAPLPAISALEPDTVVAGSGPQEIRVIGRNFASNSEVLANAAALPTQFVSASQLSARLPNQTATGTLQVQVRTPSQGQALVSPQAALLVQAPVPPTLAVEPTPIALPPDDRAHDITLRLSKADYRDNVLTLSVADATKASVSPVNLVIAAGQTSARISVVGKLAGTSSLNIDSPTLASVRVPMFITADYRGANTAIAAPVGVVIPQTSTPATRAVSVTHPTVGVAVGAVLTGVDPAAWGVASETVLTVHGRDIAGDAQIALQPDTGVRIGAVRVNAQGTQLTAQLQTAADAALGVRKVVLTQAGGRAIEFADPAQSMVSILTGVPVMESIEPIAVLRGTMARLSIRGRHLQRGRVSIDPADGVAIDTQPEVSADGKTLTVRLSIAPDAAVGSRAIQVATPAGSTGSQPTSSNTLTIASSLQDRARAIVSLPVGVQLGVQTPTGTTVSSFQSSAVAGVLVGSGVTQVVPRVAVVGTDVVVTVRGAGLQGMTAAGFVPATGLTVLNAPVVDAQANEAQFTVRVAATAARGTRRLVLHAGNQPLGFVHPGHADFLITAPVPELVSVSPQVIVAGQAPVTLDIRGRNFSNITGARIEPAEAMTVAGPFTVSDNGTRLGLQVQAATGAASGERSIIVSSAAGDSSAMPAPGNLLRVARQVAATYAGLQSAAVGVVLGNAPVDSAPQRWLSSPQVGLMLGTAAPASGQSATASSADVGVLLGAGARSMAPNGWLRGANGTLLVTGQGLASVVGARVVPDTGLLLGAPVVNADGTRLTLSLAVAPDAPMLSRKLRLLQAAGGNLLFTDSAAGRFDIGQMPTLVSLAPIVFEQGQATTLTLRGSRLQGVTGVIFEPSGGIRAVPAPTWGRDDFGETLRMRVLVERDAAVGRRVLRLQVPGGMTGASPQVFNSLTVVPPQ